MILPHMNQQFILAEFKKITSETNSKIANLVNNPYKKIKTAGKYKASSIKFAEKSKVIKNTQRDLNIALINELSVIYVSKIY